MSTDGIYADAIARLARKKAMLAADQITGGERGHGRVTWYPRPRPLSDWIRAGTIMPGYEANDLVFPYRVIDALNDTTLPDGTTEFLVMGETNYPSGVFFLEFGMNPRWIEAKSNWRFLPDRPNSENPVWVCPVCGGIGEEHHKVEYEGRTVKCPKAPAGYRWPR